MRTLTLLNSEVLMPCSSGLGKRAARTNSAARLSLTLLHQTRKLVQLDAVQIRYGPVVHA